MKELTGKQLKNLAKHTRSEGDWDPLSSVLLLAAGRLAVTNGHCLIIIDQAHDLPDEDCPKSLATTQIKAVGARDLISFGRGGALVIGKIGNVCIPYSAAAKEGTVPDFDQVIPRDGASADPCGFNPSLVAGVMATMALLLTDDCGDSGVSCQFHGKLTPVTIRGETTDRKVLGVIMPMRLESHDDWSLTTAHDGRKAASNG